MFLAAFASRNSASPPSPPGCFSLVPYQRPEIEDLPRPSLFPPALGPLGYFIRNTRPRARRVFAGGLAGLRARFCGGRSGRVVTGGAAADRSLPSRSMPTGGAPSSATTGRSAIPPLRTPHPAPIHFFLHTHIPSPAFPCRSHESHPRSLFIMPPRVA